MKDHGKIRLVLAMLISPLLPILALSSVYRLETGNWTWLPIFLLFGYLFFAVIGLPVAGLLITRRTIRACFIGGGAVAVAPILLISLFSIFAGSNIYTLEMAMQLVALFVVGGLGGAVFWLIAFFGHGSREVDS